MPVAPVHMLVQLTTVRSVDPNNKRETVFGFDERGNQISHIDKLGRTGIQFKRFYVNSFCAPTRAALLTGRYPLRCGVWGVTHNKEAMRPEEVTIAEALRQAGYRTPLGKIPLPLGRQRLTLETVSLAGDQTLELKGVTLKFLGK